MYWLNGQPNDRMNIQNFAGMIMGYQLWFLTKIISENVTLGGGKGDFKFLLKIGLENCGSVIKM